MSKNLINFASKDYYFSQELSAHMAKEQGINQIFSYREADLEKFSDFKRENAAILKQSRGYGFWLWKPFLIKHALEQLSPGEVLMYCDSGLTIVADPSPLFELCDRHQQIFFSGHRHLNKEWTKRDVAVALDCDSDEFWNLPQLNASCSLWRHCKTSFARLEEWYSYCTKEQLLTDLPSRHPNAVEFQEHKHDQSIISALVYRWKASVFRDPSQNGLDFRMEFPNSPYDMITYEVGKLTPDDLQDE